MNKTQKLIEKYQGAFQGTLSENIIIHSHLCIDLTQK